MERLRGGHTPLYIRQMTPAIRITVSNDGSFSHYKYSGGAGGTKDSSDCLFVLLKKMPMISSCHGLLILLGELAGEDILKDPKCGRELPNCFLERRKMFFLSSSAVDTVS